MTGTTAPTAAPETSTQVSVRTVPWMKLGQLIDEPLTAAEAAKLGGLDFTVVKRPIWYASADGDDARADRRIDERVVTVREDTGRWLGIMARNYPVLQFRDAFDFMDGVSAHYVAAGALKGGRQGFMVVRAPETFEALADVDPHELYAVLRTSHDGSRAVEVSVMPLRGLCMNQLTLRSFTAGVRYRWSIKHTSSMEQKLRDARTSLINLGAYARSFEDTARRLIKMRITDAVARETVTAALPDRPKRDEQVERIVSLWHLADTVGFDWTGWGLVNATSEYFDWHRTGGSPESRFVGALQGQTHNVVNRVAGRLLSRA